MNNNMKRHLIAALLAGCFGSAQAAPTLPQVVSGQATFGQQGNVFTITNTPNAIINWQSFSVKPGEVTRFVQQSADSAVLNRITGQDPSQILGALQSNGQVFLLNPNGIMFGRDARIDVNGLTASTLNLSDADFLSGRRNFSAGAAAGKLVNQGAITTPHGGKVYLIAANVENSGIINAPNGEIVLAAGHSVQLVDSANPDLRVSVSAPSGEAVNLGQVVAQGGQIGIYGALVRQRGVVNANSAVRGADGRITLKASGDTLLEAGSVTSATGAGKGGSVQVLGERVALTGDARIEASGEHGGGTVLVGGDFQGKNALVPNARQAWVGKDASIRADAGTSGDGGKVIVWSDGATRAFGAISARGGAAGGNGGLVETSGHYLDVSGARVDAGAVKGSIGSWLLDPLNIIVDIGGTDALSDADTFAENSDQTTRIAPSLINSATTRVILQATNNIDFNSAISIASGAGSLRAEAGNAININAPISANGGTLDFRAANSLTLAGGASLDTSGYIDIQTDNIVIGGTIGSAATRPNVSFTPFSADRGMRISNSKTGSELALSPAELNRITGFGINIGSSANSGDITVAANYTADAGKTPNLVLATSGSIVVEGGIDLSNHADSHVQLGRYGSGFGSGKIEVIETGVIKSNSILARSDKLVLSGALDAGADGSITVMPHNAGTMIALGGSAYDESGLLGLSNTELGNMIAGAVTIGGNDGQSGRLAVTGEANFANAGKVVLDAGEGNLDIDAALTSNGKLTLNSANQITQGGDGFIAASWVEARGSLVDLALANSVGMVGGRASSGVFHFGAAGDLTVSGTTTGGGDIVLDAAGKLTIDKTVSAGAGTVELTGEGIVSSDSGSVSAGSVRLASTAGVGANSAAFKLRTGSLTVDNHDAGASAINIANTGALVLGRVQQTAPGSSGAVRIANVGAVTIPATDPFEPDARARVRSGAGAITLTSTGAMTIDGSVESQAGNIALEAGNGALLKVGSTGIVSTDAGNIALKGRRVSNGGSVTAPAGSVSTSETAPPVQPPVEPPKPPKPPEPPVPPVPPVPQAPTLGQCIAAPATAGCTSVLPSIAQCTATPSAQGCSVILPSVGQCSISPSTPGCSVVLPSLGQCSSAPATQGCSAVLPSLSQCAVAPTTAGCSVVLPTLTQCVIAPSTLGCSVVLPSLNQCVASPSMAGCSSVLPSLSQCTAAPSTPGCSSVLPTLAQCNSSPFTPGCSSVLPSLSQCTATPSQSGCSVVLPTLAQCAASPGLQGCTVVLPAPDRCIAAPESPGCAAVNPAPTANPGQNQLAVTLQQQVSVQAVTKTTVAEPAGPTTEESKKTDTGKSEAAPLFGAKDEIRKKTYCN
ncbi:two-partner secretion domain-containing protein [Massilia soli]|uniref:Filamentous hemagglutinin N-terminal domain-containing protein n=1 Tax=Massilia soli TaxID=2792854 RepID=A0ABS7SRE8_9BURK|nr:filamentous hemagglutinin N-terminal domain-containing protein [Massilia soli]MBZ2208521.1 filamentous hemagglutinin N-terminal domain-containing protein [Massilia soli]